MAMTIMSSILLSFQTFSGKERSNNEDQKKTVGIKSKSYCLAKIKFVIVSWKFYFSNNSDKVKRQMSLKVIHMDKRAL